MALPSSWRTSSGNERVAARAAGWKIAAFTSLMSHIWDILVKAKRRDKKFLGDICCFCFSGDRWGRLRAPGCFFRLGFGVDNLGVGIVARQAALFCGELEGFFAVELGLADEFFDAVGEALRGIGVGARISGGFRGDQEANFAASGAVLEGSGEFGEVASAKRLK